MFCMNAPAFLGTRILLTTRRRNWNAVKLYGEKERIAQGEVPGTQAFRYLDSSLVWPWRMFSFYI